MVSLVREESNRNICCAGGRKECYRKGVYTTSCDMACAPAFYALLQWYLCEYVGVCMCVRVYFHTL